MVETQAHDEPVLFPSTSPARRAHQLPTIVDSDGLDGISIWFISLRDKDEERVVTPLNRAARNELFRKNPNLIAAAIEQIQRLQAKQQGRYQTEECIISWHASFVPFHLEYTVNSSKGECKHLVSVRNRSLEEPVS